MGAFDTSLGALLIGAFINTYLYGLSTFQYASYWNTEFNDPLWIKVSIGSLFCIDTAHSASIVYMTWEYMVAHYAEPSFLLEKVVWPLPFSVIVVATIAFGIQNFLAMRIYRLMGRKWLLYTFVLWSTATLIWGLVYGVKITMSKSFMDILALKKPLTVWLSMEVGLDISISAVLFTAIQRSRMGFKRSDAVLNRLGRSAIQSGVFTSILAILALACFSGLSDTLFYATFGMPCARAYTISLLDTMNCRKDLRELMLESNTTKDGFGLSTLPDLFTRDTTTPSGTWHMHTRKDVQTEVNYESGTRTSESALDDLSTKPTSLFLDTN